MSGQWTKLTVKCNVADLDLVTSIMSMLDNGLMIEDYSDFSFRGMYGELVDEEILHADMNTAKVSLFVPEEKNLAEYTSFLKERFAVTRLDVGMTFEGLCEDDWAESWKQYYKPVPLGKVTIVPAWENYGPREDETVVRMDPGMAFGTGTHETTRLVLLLMQDLPLTGKRVLDVGTGSGILSICASKLGAKDCHGYDIDPVAVKVAAENAKADGCDNVTVGVSDLLRDVDLSGGRYDFCVANIVADIILRMLPDMTKYLKPGAPLILSGIIEPRAGEVRDALAKYGFRIVREMQENDWIGIHAEHD